MGDYGSGDSSGTGNTNCGNVKNSYNHNIWNNYTIASLSDRKRGIPGWLASLDAQGNQQDKRHQDIRHSRVDGVGDWLLGAGQFLEWRDSEDGSVNRILFCCGDPGVGKTYLR